MESLFNLIVVLLVKTFFRATRISVVQPPGQCADGVRDHALQDASSRSHQRPLFGESSYDDKCSVAFSLFILGSALKENWDENPEKYL